MFRCYYHVLHTPREILGKAGLVLCEKRTMVSLIVKLFEHSGVRYTGIRVV